MEDYIQRFLNSPVVARTLRIRTHMRSLSLSEQQTIEGDKDSLTDEPLEGEDSTELSKVEMERFWECYFDKQAWNHWKDWHQWIEWIEWDPIAR